MKNPKYSKKIIFRQVPYAPEFREDLIRQQMLNETNSDWFVIVDGDEIWPEESLDKVIETIKQKGKNRDGIIVPTINLLGDFYHYQEEAAGRYTYYGKKGHYKLCWFNRLIPGLKSQGRGWDWGWVDEDGNKVSERGEKRIIFVDAPYLHATHLTRSTKAVNKKMKYELGKNLPSNFKYPKVLYLQRPTLVPDPWKKRSFLYILRAAIETAPRKLKRRLENFLAKNS